MQKSIIFLVSKKSNSDKIKTVGVLIEEPQFLKNRILSTLQKNLNVKLENIEILIFKPFDRKQNYLENEITEKNFGWFGYLKLNKLEQFVKNKYDLLINYGFEENLYWKIITLQSRASFKVGFSSLQDNKLYHLSILDKTRDVNILNNEIEKYLKILKKID